jgi:ribosomal-protein-alanine N-acetyltransferase
MSVAHDIRMIPANVTLRLATLADSLDIAEMSRDYIESGLGWSWTRTRVARNIASPNTVTLVANDHERMIAFAIMYCGDEHAHLNLLAVRPEYRRAGIGAHLVEWLEGTALAAGIATIRLELRAGNEAARSFYRKLGFAEIARVPHYYGGVETAVRMSRDVRRAPGGAPVDWKRFLR